jgi:hypothetical protein
MLLTQIGLFFVARYVRDFRPSGAALTAAPVPASTQDAIRDLSAAPEAPVQRTDANGVLATGLQYVTNLIDFLGITMAAVLAVVLLMVTLILLVARLIGVSHVTSAFIWSIVLVFLLFPWQAFLIHDDRARADAGVSAAVDVSPQPSFKIPGVLYTWPELVSDARFDASRWESATLKWARFVGFPVLAMIILITVQSKSGRGMKFALGESDVQVEITSPR